ncbi:MAG: L,D-transpeptidase [Bdellovibrionales bacterium]|nr:L,D-transpeptidase [Bdellovibrionales bacterium]
MIKKIFLHASLIALASGCASTSAPRHPASVDTEEKADLFDYLSPDEIAQYMDQNNVKVEAETDEGAFDANEAVPVEIEIRVYSSNHKRAPGPVKKEHIDVFRNGQRIYTWLTSTASDKMKYPSVGQPYMPETPRGTYSIQRAVRNEVSHQFNNAPMNFAMYFGPKVPSGIAVHATYGADHLAKLGTPDSAGCVRLSEIHAKTLFELVVNQIGIKKARVIVSDLQDKTVMYPLSP